MDWKAEGQGLEINAYNGDENVRRWGPRSSEELFPCERGGGGPEMVRSVGPIASSVHKTCYETTEREKRGESLIFVVVALFLFWWSIFLAERPLLYVFFLIDIIKSWCVRGHISD